MRRTVFAVAALAVAWWVASALVGSRVLPSPVTVAVRFAQVWSPALWRHTLASTARVVAALILAAAVAVPLGIGAGRVAAIDRVVTPPAYLLYPVPKIALLPVLLILLGTGDVTRVAVVFLVLFFQMYIAVRDGARSVDPHYLQSIDSLGGTRLDRLRYVVWPVVLPGLLTALRIGSGTALAVLFFAETFFTRYGLGFYIVDSWMKLAYPDMFAGIVAMSLLGLGLFSVIDAVDRRVSRWRS